MVFAINMGTGVNVNNISTNGTVTSGENQQFGWSSHQKRIYDITTSGIFNTVLGNLVINIDNDIIDSTFNDPDLMSGMTNQLI